MRNSRAGLLLTVVVVGCLLATPFAASAVTTSATDVGVTAGVLAAGVSSRAIVGTPTVTPLALPANATNTTLTGTMAVTVAEIAMTGSASWSVTAQLKNDFTGPSGATIASSALHLAPSSPTVVGLASGVSAAAGSAGALTKASSGGTAVTLFSVSGESTAGLYDGTYTGNGALTLTVPNGSTAGTYTSTMTVTLTY
ncbi:MAG: hypothetical protein ABR507_04675 [Actinomycetota bacterium]|nr:hypothetical protein [Actinomycetota bacterium]